MNWTYVSAYLFSTVGGWLVLGLLVPVMHWTCGTLGTPEDQAGKWRPVFRWIDIWGGFTERSIATTLFIWAPNQLPLFIGGWVAIKLAAGWSRLADQKYAPAHVVGLVGLSISFAIAIAAGIMVHPESLEALNASND